MTQQPGGYGYPPQQYPQQPPYQQPAQPQYPQQYAYPQQPQMPTAPQYPAQSPPAAQQYAPPAAQQLGQQAYGGDVSLDGDGELKQTARPRQPRFTDLVGRLLYINPTGIEDDTNDGRPGKKYGARIIADVMFADGGPVTHSVRDGVAEPLEQPVMPGQLMTGVWITASRLVPALRPYIGTGKRFARRLGKDGRAFVLLPVTEQETQQVTAMVRAALAQQAANAQAGNPLLAGQPPTQPVQQPQSYQHPPAPPMASQAPQGGQLQPMPNPYGQQFPVPPAGYGAAAQQPQWQPPAQGTPGMAAGQQFTAMPPQAPPEQQLPPGGIAHFDPANWAQGQPQQQ